MRASPRSSRAFLPRVPRLPTIRSRRSRRTSAWSACRVTGLCGCRCARLIEGAHRGLGLGHRFLRHLERTSVLVHIVDVSSASRRDPVDDLTTVRRSSRSSARARGQAQIVAANKIDALDDEGRVLALAGRADELKLLARSARCRTLPAPLDLEGGGTPTRSARSALSHHRQIDGTPDARAEPMRRRAGRDDRRVSANSLRGRPDPRDTMIWVEGPPRMRHAAFAHGQALLEPVKAPVGEGSTRRRIHWRRATSRAASGPATSLRAAPTPSPVTPEMRLEAASSSSARPASASTRPSSSRASILLAATIWGLAASAG